MSKRLWPSLCLLALACGSVLRVAPPLTATPTSRPATSPPRLPTPTALPSATPLVLPPVTPAPDGYVPVIHFEPQPQLFTGDIASFEIIGENAPTTWREANVTLHVGDWNTAPLATTTFGPFGIGGRAQATFTWVWDTAALTGPQTLITVIQPQPPQSGDHTAPTVVTFTVNLLPAEQRPAPEPQAHWAQTESACCRFHYLTHTAAERDLHTITTTAEAAFSHIQQTLGVSQTEKVTFTLLSRLLGHGGFAGNEISLTYLDRNAVASDLRTLFTHEGTHILDRQIAQDKPTIMTEGLAVYVAGGHFKPEDLEARAAALLALPGFYIPLTDLANNFYPAQHEIGYFEAGALIHYLVQTYGWDRFRAFYASFKAAPTDGEKLDAALRLNFNVTLSDLEGQWLAHLRARPHNPDAAGDVRLTVQLYDTLRRYQQLKDPSAYFLTAWLPDVPTARQRAITADFVRGPRGPRAPLNIAYEALLNAAGRALRAQAYVEAKALLTDLNTALAADNPLAAPLAADYFDLVNQVAQTGAEAQTIAIEGQVAAVSAIRKWPTLSTLTFTRTDAGWQLATGYNP